MRLKLAIALVLAMALFISLAVRQRVAREEQASGLVRTDFKEGAALSRDELREIVKLAAHGGAAPVVEVSNGHRNGRILVRGNESTIGREVTSTEMWIERVNNPSGRNPRFRISSANPFTYTTFDVGGRKARVIRHDTLSLPDADRIMKAFAKGDVRYADVAVEQRLKQVNLLSVIELASSQSGGGRYRAYFPAGDSGLLATSFDLAGDASILIVSAERMVLCF
jgi:hypothetical protein